MRQTGITRLARLLCLVALCFVWVNPSTAAEPQPGEACPAVDQFVRVGGPENPGTGYFLVCDGSIWQTILSFNNDGDAGVGNSVPKAPLHVGGEAIIGTTTGLACDADREGAIRYNTTVNCLELCDGAAFTCISVGACADATPAAFDFTDLVNQATSTQVESSILQITDLGCIVNVTISGEGSPEFRTCSASDCSTVVLDWRSASGTISDDEYLQLRLTTSATGGDVFSAIVNVGTVADVWNATPTGDCTGSPAAGTVCADGTVFAGNTPDGNVKMYVTRCDAGMTWDGTACTGTRLGLSWNDGDTNFVATSMTSQVTGATNTANIVTVDANSVLAGDQPHITAAHCIDLSQDGQTDWYLPASEELNVMYGNKGVIGNFDTSGLLYWSSTEILSNNAVRLRFTDGLQGTGVNKNVALPIRCARKD